MERISCGKRLLEAKRHDAARSMALRLSRKIADNGARKRHVIIVPLQDRRGHPLHVVLEPGELREYNLRFEVTLGYSPQDHDSVLSRNVREELMLNG